MEKSAAIITCIKSAPVYTKIKRFDKLLLIFLLFSCSSVFAELPKPPCNTICTSNASLLKKGEKCIALEGKQIYIRKSGSGKATVIFSSGTGISADIWFTSKIASEIAKNATTLTYDRLYTFNSCNNSNDFMPVTADNVAQDLHKLITLLELPPPYILVGHSMGGLYLLNYARLYPQGIAGLVLLDATSSEGPTPLPKAAIPLLKGLGNPQNPDPNNSLYNEMIGQLPSYLQVQQTPKLSKDIPVIVLSANRHCLPIAWTKKEMCMTVEQEKNHQRRQKDIAALSNQSKYLLLQGNHNIFFSKDGYQIVVDAIRQLLNKLN